MYHYSSPPPRWSTYDYTTASPTSPHYSHYASQYAAPSPRGVSKRHSRKASYTTARETSGWYSAYANYHDTVPEYASPRKHDNVSANFGDMKKKTKKKARRRFSMPGDSSRYAYYDGFGLGYDYVHPSRSQKRSIFVDVVDDADDEPAYVYREPKQRNAFSQHHHHDYYHHHQRFSYNPPTDEYSFYNQVPVHDDDVAADSPKRARARRASTSTRTPPKPKMAAPPKSPRKATEEDARRAGIPEGYSIKNWDPTEEPILLLGSVFDANSLGKWIYDWTVYYHGASTPMADVAGELWLLLIKLAGKVKRADECLDRVHRAEAREMLTDFLDSGDRLWARFKALLKDCEQYMWKAAKRENGGKNPVSMGHSAGCEFVESIFGRDRKLQDTEKLMNSIRLWDMRFDANCEAILRPSRRQSNA
ncbi:hypothetical protein VTN77DRAFT_265 [Rasamsonia byssochlamydoides]|uniref:uncharacterized protein n=1 Tax=Rasamsonia byssochlamydoides TaxID=89139 RepID=UPI003742403C